MRKRSALAALATAAVLSTSAITPASAYTKVYTQVFTFAGSDREDKSCSFYSDENLNAFDRFRLYDVLLDIEVQREVEKLDFIDELFEWREQPSNAPMPQELKQKILAAGFKESEMSNLRFSSETRETLSKHAEIRLLSWGLPYIGTPNEKAYFMGLEIPSNVYVPMSEDTFSRVQERVKPLDFTSLESFQASRLGAFTEEALAPTTGDFRVNHPDAAEPSTGMRELQERAFNNAKPRLSNARDNLVRSTYSEYLSDIEAHRAQLGKASEGCSNWRKGKASKEEIPFYAGSLDNFKPERTVDEILEFVFGKPDETPTPGDVNGTDETKPDQTNAGSGSTGGILVLVLAIVAILSGLGSWLSGIIPGMPKSPIAR